MRPSASPKAGKRLAAGFTLIELIVALGIASVLSLAVWMMYKANLEAYQRARAELKHLQSFRNATDRMQRELCALVWKATYIPETWQPVGRAATTFKAHNDGFARTNFYSQYLGFYTGPDDINVDRVEYYYNEPEAKADWADGVDNDGDDPDENDDGDRLGGASELNLLVDDKGTFMMLRTCDTDLVWKGTPGGADYICHYEDAYMAPNYTNGQPDNTPNKQDRGEILCEDVESIRFYYVYTKAYPGNPTDKMLYFADRWPYFVDDNRDGLNDNATKDEDKDKYKDLTGLVYGYVGPNPQGNNVDFRKGLSYLTLPLAIHVQFDFRRTMGAPRRYLKTVYLPSSKWQEYVSKATVAP